MPRKPSNGEPDPLSVIKILISTDNHLGYLEKDPVRGNDSFRAFEEVLEIARVNEVDMILLGGDLFHENKPSRATIVKTMKILRKACMDPDRVVRLGVRSDPAKVNYMNPNMCISLPIFLINGNHDDPTGGIGNEALSPIDVLAEAGLVTYFGKHPNASKIDLSPILLQKGSTPLAIYGLGSIRDEVLYKTWAIDHKVRWANPSEPSDPNHELASNELPWFHLFVLHQNRVIRGTAKAIADTMLPPWLNYVVWGHEHDSIPELTHTEPPIVQPGSTVATSLIAGEAKQKHAIMLEVFEGRLLKHQAIPLQSVRHFQFEDVVLSEQKNLSDTDPEALTNFLRSVVDEMVVQQEGAFDDKVSKFQNNTFKRSIDGVKYPSCEFYRERMTELVRQPLIRLRVEISGNWRPPNPQRFGQSSIGRVACPADMVTFYRRKKLQRRRMFLSGQVAPRPDEITKFARDDGQISSMPEEGTEAEQIEIPELVQQFLCNRKVGGNGLKFLELDKLSDAVEEFVNKCTASAIPDYVKKFMDTHQKQTLDEVTDGKALNEDELLVKFQKQAEEAARNANTKLHAAREVNKNRVNRSNTKTDKSTIGAKDKVDAITPNDPKPDAPEPTQEERQRAFEERLDQVHELLTGIPRVQAIMDAYKNKMDRMERDGSEDEAASGRKTKGTSRAGRGRGRGKAVGSSTGGRRPARRKPSPMVIEDSDGAEEVEGAGSEEEYVPAPTARKRRARNAPAESNSRAAPRSRVQTQSQLSFGRQATSARRTRVRRNTATINVDEESGDDAM